MWASIHTAILGSPRPGLGSRTTALHRQRKKHKHILIPTCGERVALLEEKDCLLSFILETQVGVPERDR